MVTHQAEQHLLRRRALAPASGVRIHVVCPGLVYGLGEGKDQLYGLFREAWEGRAALTVYGDGTNRLPVVHASSLASFVEAVALGSAPPPHGYLLACEPQPVTQAELAAGLAVAFDAPQPPVLVGAEDVLCAPSARPAPPGLLLLDLPLSPSTWPGCTHMPTGHPGLLAGLEGVREEFLRAQQLAPLRIVLRGPPCAGEQGCGAAVLCIATCKLRSGIK